MRENLRFNNNFRLLRIMFAIFAIALVFSFFHYHKNFEVNEKYCSICSFSMMLMAAALVWFVFLMISTARPLIVLEVFLKPVLVFMSFCALRAPPQFHHIDSGTVSF